MPFHIHPKTGEAGACKAEQGRCPYGAPNEHYPTREAAQAAFEKSQATFEEEPYASVETEELERLETSMLEEHRSSKEPLSDDEYARHYEYLRRIRKLPSTHKQNTKSVKGKTVYTDERLAQHEEIVAALDERYASIPAEGKVLFVGGITGAGKSTTLKTHSELQAHSYAAVNPDQVKYEMAERSMTPDVPGVLPLETDELIKYEAQVISEKSYDSLSDQRKNLVIDRTMTSTKQITKTVDELKAKGYTDFSAVFVDVDPDEAYDRIRARHRDGVDAYFRSGEGHGERSVPGSAIAATRIEDDHYRSKNAKIFVELADAGVFESGVAIFDSSDDNRELSLDEFRA